MVTVDIVRRLASALPETEDGSGREQLAFSVRGKRFAWTWLEREAPKPARRPRIDVLAVRCAKEFKAILLEAEPDMLFTEPHYDGFPAVLVRLDVVTESRLAELLRAAWFCQAPNDLARALASAVNADPATTV